MSRGPARAARLAALAAALAATAVSARALADALMGGSARVKHEWYLMPGVNVGATVEEGTAHFLLGAEVSAARLHRRGGWFGAYIDGLRDFRRSSFRGSLGVEAGYTLLGADLGAVWESGEDGGVGLRARLILTMGWAGVAAGPVIRLGEAEQRMTGELSLVVKIPLPLEGGRLSPSR